MNGTAFPSHPDYGGDHQGGGFDHNPAFKKPWQGGGGGNNWQKGNNGGGWSKKPRKEDPKDSDPNLYKPYVVYANSNPPVEIIEKFKSLAIYLESIGFTVRIGGNNDGVDQAVEDVTKNKELILPWKEFNGKESPYTWAIPASEHIAKQFSPIYDSMKDGVKKFLARNARLIMGQKMRSKACFLLCWSEDGAETKRELNARSGFIQHPVAIANGALVPVFNLGKPDAEQRLRQFVTPQVD